MKRIFLTDGKLLMNNATHKYFLSLILVVMFALASDSCDKTTNQATTTTDHTSIAVHLSVCPLGIGTGAYPIPHQPSLDPPCMLDSAGDTLVFGFELAQKSSASIVVYDNSDSVVAAIANDTLYAGYYFPKWINPKRDEVYGVKLIAKALTTGATYSDEYWFFSN